MNLPPLSPASEKVMAAAAKASSELGQAYLGVEHLFIGLASEARAPLAKALTAQGADLDTVVELLRSRAATQTVAPVESDAVVYTRRGREVLQLAGRIAGGRGEGLVQPQHLLESIFSEGRSLPSRLLAAQGVDISALQHSLVVPGERESKSDTPLLARYGRDLTALARAGRLSPLIGRKTELDLLAQVLLRRNKNNPVLVGEAGVGKTAVVEGFAQRLVADDCPEPFCGARIVELSVGALVAGTKYRGEFEERLLGIVAEIAANPEIHLFLDEIHTLVGAGSANGDALDASNIIKPALARGEIRCIGATTVDEFRRYIEQDPALERRFERVLIEEPSPREALEILTRLSPLLESHHHIRLAGEAIEAAVELTVRHVPDRRLPDKALDALDQTCARRRLRELTSDAPASGEIGPAEIVKTVSQWTGIPLERLTPEAARELLDLGDRLGARVMGQDHAVDVVARAIVTARAGLASPDRPIGVFMFTGPTGVGKTLLAKSLAEELFGDVSRLVRFDMSEFTEPHTVSKLIGAPPGYVGHEREGDLIKALRTRPHCVVLFDEVEKAHRDVFDVFLQIFDEGRLTGAHGRSADFTQSVVILTSNLDPTPPPPPRTVGFTRDDEGEAPVIDPQTAMTAYLRPELVNRIDEVVVFERLGRQHLRRIVEGYVQEIEQLLARRELSLELDDEAYDLLLRLGASDRFGARELRRVVDRHLRQPLARDVLSRGRGDEAASIRVSTDAGALRFD